MKKTLLSLAIISCLLLTGCSEEKNKLDKNISESIKLDESGAALVCTSDYDYTELEYVIGSKYVVFADKEGKVTKVVSREIISSKDKTKLDEFESYLNENHTVASEYDGYTFELNREKNKVTSDVTIDYNKFDLKKFAEDNDSITEKDIDLTVDTIEKQYVSLGAKCTKK